MNLTHIWSRQTKIHDDYIKNRFTTWLLGRPSWTSDRMILAIFYLKVTPILRIKFRLNWPSIQEKKFRIVFSRWQLCKPLCISDRNDFSFFWSTSHLDDSYQVSSQLAFRFRRRSEKWIFKMAAILDFQSEQFYLFLIYQSPLCFLSSSSQLAFRFRRRSNK